MSSILVLKKTKKLLTFLFFQGINCWNPAFDVTPSELITGGIITELGIFKANELEKNLKNQKKN